MIQGAEIMDGGKNAFLKVLIQSENAFFGIL